MITQSQIDDFRMLVKAANCGTLALMEVQDSETGQIQTVMAIVRPHSEDSPQAFFIPVAMLIEETADFMFRYRPVTKPDGSVVTRR